MADALAEFPAPSVDDQRILRVLSVICEPIARERLQQILDALDWRDQAGKGAARLEGAGPSQGSDQFDF